MKFLSVIVLIAAIIILDVLPVRAATVKSGETALISVPINDDVYVAGGKVIVEEEISEDAIVAGGSLLINGAVGQDLIIAGGSLLINGPVGDDLRAAGGEITISENIADDLIVAGGSITIDQGVTVGGDLLVAGGQVILAGVVMGDAKVFGGEVVFNGTVHGNTDFHTGKLNLNGTVDGKTLFTTSEVTLGPDATFGGDIEYWREDGEIDFGSSSVSGTTTFNPELHFTRDFSEKAPIGFLIGWLFFSLLSGAVLILVFVLMTKTYFSQAVERLRESFWKNVGLGFLYFIVTPIIALLFFLTIIGIPLGLFIFILYLFSLFFAKVLTAIVLAKWIEIKRNVQWGKVTTFFTSVGLFIILKLLMFIPIAGWIALAIIVCAAFGAIMATDWKLYRKVA
ncbi:MAG: hypothetical protein GY721_13790 [Deltaproteobacteria bacterium]|nr:hypothetical protein [Deltaproteobacteria bacterium]